MVRQSTECITLKTTVGNDLPQLHQQAIHTVSLPTEKKYTYTVRCLDKKDKFVSGFSKTGKTNLFLAPPAISSVSKAENGNLISWKSVSGADGYRLYRKSYGSSWSRIVSTTDNSFVDTTAGKNTVIAYTLRCLDEKGNLISSYIDKTKYYRNGELANGTVTVNGKKTDLCQGCSAHRYADN